MISIISGKYKGKKLYPFNHPKVRPTQAKIRKSIFQILEPFSSLKHGKKSIESYCEELKFYEDFKF